MANLKISELTENTARHFNDLAVMVDDPAGTPLTQKMKFLNLTGLIVNAQTGTTYTYLTGDYGKLVSHTNGSAIAGTLPQAGATFPANWFVFVQNRGAGALTITPTTSTIDGAATLVLNQNEGALIVSDGTNYFTSRGKATGGVGGVGDVVGPGSATDNALVRFDSTTGKLIQNSTVTLDDTGAFTVPEMAAPATPASGMVAIYAKSDGKLYIKDDTGAETDLTGGGGAGGAILTENLSDAKITALTAATTMLDTDLFAIVDDPGGTPITKKITKANMLQPEVNQGENLASASKRWAVTYSAQFNAKAGDEYRWEASSRLIDLGDGFLLYRSNAGGTVKLSLGDSSSAATMIKRNGIVLEVRLGDDSAYGPLMAGTVRTNPVTFANVPGTPVEGMLVTVTDSSTATWGATITGGGANRVLAYFNGTNWTVAAA